MARIGMDNFGGIAPRMHPTLLGANMAVRAHNCLLKNGKLVPIRHPAQVRGMQIRMENGLSAIGDAKTLYMWHYAEGAKEVVAWPGKVYIAESNLSNDKYHRLFVSGETGVGDDHPCVYMRSEDGLSVRRHDLTKEPLPAPEVSLKDGEPSDPTNARYTVFVQTWVDAYGYESGASMPSEELEYTDGDAVIVGYCTAPSLAVKRRLYKVVAGTESESVQFVKEQERLGAAFQRIEVRLADEDAGEVIPTLQAPAEDLEMICKVPNGFYAGVSRSNRREVRFSESGNPTIWPDAYTASVGDDIVGLGVTLNTVFVLTKGKPWAVTGTAPDAMSAAVLASPQACVSAESICAYDGKVFYASADGVCMLADGSASVALLTDKIFGRRDWQAYHPETCKIIGYNGTLFCWFLYGGSQQSVAISLLDDSSVAVTTHDEVAKAAFVDVEEDEMYFVRSV